MISEALYFRTMLFKDGDLCFWSDADSAWGDIEHATVYTQTEKDSATPDDQGDNLYECRVTGKRNYLPKGKWMQIPTTLRLKTLHEIADEQARRLVRQPTLD